MQSIIQSAMKFSGQTPPTTGDATGAESQDGEFEAFGEPRIVIVGCGGAGNNTINRLHKLGVRGAETIAINTDKVHLDIIEADKKLLIGKSITRGSSRNSPSRNLRVGCRTVSRSLSRINRG